MVVTIYFLIGRQMLNLVVTNCCNFLKVNPFPVLEISSTVNMTPNFYENNRNVQNLQTGFGLGDQIFQNETYGIRFRNIWDFLLPTREETLLRDP